MISVLSRTILQIEEQYRSGTITLWGGRFLQPQMEVMGSCGGPGSPCVPEHARAPPRSRAGAGCVTWAGSPDPAAQGAEIAMYEVAAGVHSHATIDEGLDVAGDRVVVDIWNMNIERHCAHMLRVQRRTFELRIGL